ncbi:MAG: T9SS type A sorting domain-containing protein [Bacteroidales bacterium]
MGKFTIYKLFFIIALVFTSFQVKSQESSSGCDYRLEMKDSFGDGWSGNTLKLWVGDQLVFDAIKLEDGKGPEYKGFKANTGDKIKIQVTAISQDYPEEISWALYNPNGDKVASQGPGIYTFDKVIVDALCPSPVDMAISEWKNPASSSLLGDQETVTLELLNQGTEVMNSDFLVYYSVDGKKVTETVSGVSIASGAKYEYTFAQKADFSVSKIYECEAGVIAEADGNVTNDKIEKGIYKSVLSSLYFHDNVKGGIIKADLPSLANEEEIFETIDIQKSFKSFTFVEDGNFYGISNRDSLLVVNLKSKELQKPMVLDIKGVNNSFNAMTYDYKNKQLLVLSASSNQSTLYRLDMAVNKFVELKSFDSFISHIAATKDGKIYIVTKKLEKSVLCELDPFNFAITEKLSLDRDYSSSYFRNLLVDFNTNVLYMVNSDMSDSDSEVTVIDIENSKSLDLGSQNAGIIARAATTAYQEDNVAHIIDFGASNQKYFANINRDNGVVDIELLYGSDVLNFVPYFVCNNGSKVKYGEKTIQSGEEKIDASNPFVLTVESKEGTVSNDYTINVTVGKNHETEILTFNISEQLESLVIDKEKHSIHGFVALDTDLSSLKPNFTLSENAMVQIKSRSQIPSKSVVDFTDPVKYVVFAEDGRKQVWTVTVAALDVPANVEIDSPDFSKEVTTEFELDWKDIDGVKGYKVFYGKEIPQEANLTVEESKTIIKDLDPYTAYKLKIVPFNSAGDCISSQVLSFNTGIKTYVMKNGNISVTDGYFYDDGVENNYSNDQMKLITLSPSESGKSVSLFFEEFMTESNTDMFSVYNGSNASSAEIQGSPFSAQDLKGEKIIADNPDGALTLGFASDKGYNTYGWKAKIELHQWLNQDIGLTSFILPTRGFNMGNSEQFSYSIKNLGKNDITSFSMILTINGNTNNKIEKEITLDSPLTPNSSVNLTDIIDLSIVQSYDVKLEVKLTGDTNEKDNSLEASTLNADKAKIPSACSFEDGVVENEYFVITNEKSNYKISDEKASEGSQAMEMFGTTYNGWSNPIVNKEWEKNEAHSSSLVWHFDLTNQKSIVLDFDALMPNKTYWTIAYMRVTVDGEMVGKTVWPESMYDGKYRSLHYDLSSYVGKDKDNVKVAIEVRSKQETNSVLIDNIRFSSLNNKELEIVELKNNLDKSAATTNEVATLGVKNTGIEAIGNFVIEAIIDGNTLTKTSKTFTPDVPLGKDDIIEVSFDGLDLSGFGVHNIQFTIMPQKTDDAIKNEFAVSCFNRPIISTLPFKDDFESASYWKISGNNPSWEIGVPAGEKIKSAGSGQKSFVTNLDGAYNAKEFSCIESPEFDLSSVEKPIVSLKTKFDIASSNYAYMEYSLDKGETWSRFGEYGKGINWYNFNGYDNTDSWILSPSETWVTSVYTDNAVIAEKPSVIFRIVLKNPYTSANNEGIAIDDFEVKESPDVDASLTEVIEPESNYFKGELKPTVKLVNHGKLPLNTTVNLDIQPGNVHFEKQISGLASDASINVEFDTWESVSGKYTLVFSINPDADVNSEDNSLSYEIVLDAAKIKAFSIQSIDAIIDEDNLKVEIEAPKDVDLTKLIPVFDLSDGATAKIGEENIVSGITEIDFSSPKTITVLAVDGTTKDWNIIVNPYREKGNDFVSFSFDGQTGESYIDNTNKIIYAELDYGLNLSAIVPNFVLSSNAVAKISEEIQEAGVSIVDFSQGKITYNIVSEFEESAEWIVEITVKPNPMALIVDVNSDLIIGDAVINSTDKTVNIIAEYHADLKKLPISFDLSNGAEIYFGENKIEGNYIFDFSSEVQLKVVAEDVFHTSIYTLKVEKEAPSNNAKLSKIQISGNDLEGFSEDNLVYNFGLPRNATDAPEVNAIAVHEKAVVNIAKAKNITSDKEEDRTSNITVTAEDNTTNLTYKVVFHLMSNDASLKNIKVNGTSIEGFASDVFNYIYKLSSIPSDVPTVEAFVTNVKAKVEVVEAQDLKSENEEDRTTLIKVTAEDGTKQTYKIIFKSTVGIDELGRELNCQLSPNPSNGCIWVKNTGADRLAIIDLNGRVVYTLQNPDLNQYLDLSNYEKGVYIISLQKNQSIMRMKLILK